MERLSAIVLVVGFITMMNEWESFTIILVRFEFLSSCTSFMLFIHTVLYITWREDTLCISPAVNFHLADRLYDERDVLHWTEAYSLLTPLNRSEITSVQHGPPWRPAVLWCQWKGKNVHSCSFPWQCVRKPILKKKKTSSWCIVLYCTVLCFCRQAMCKTDHPPVRSTQLGSVPKHKPHCQLASGNTFSQNR